MAVPQTEYYTEEDYYNIPEDVRAELIDGQIYYQAAPTRKHQSILIELCTSIKNYIKSKNGDCRVYPAPFAVKLNKDWDTIVEPDISVICDKDKLTDKGCTGAPDFIIEIISPSNQAHDYLKKLKLYADAGVREYWIVNPMKENVFVYRLEDTAFEASSYSFKEAIKVGIYEDFSIRIADLDID